MHSSAFMRVFATKKLRNAHSFWILMYILHRCMVPSQCFAVYFSNQPEASVFKWDIFVHRPASEHGDRRSYLWGVASGRGHALSGFPPGSIRWRQRTLTKKTFIRTHGSTYLRASLLVGFQATVAENQIPRKTHLRTSRGFGRRLSKDVHVTVQCIMFS